MRILFLLLASTLALTVRSQVPPQAAISNGVINARLYLPDANTGYYRGTRFDWAGVIPELKFANHDFFGQWFERYSSTLHDAIMGPVEDFAPIGFETAAPGGRFVKIGIGALTRPDTARYTFAKTYPMVNKGNWKTERSADKVTFTHTLNDSAYAYDYHKSVRLVKGKPELVIEHQFKNTGKQPIETTVYNHNFFVFDSLSVGPDYVVKFPFPITTDTAKSSSAGKIDGNNIVITRNFTPSDHVYYRALEGFTQSARDYDIRVENKKTGTGVRITCDRPLSKVVFWSAIKTVCPEPYIMLSAKPNETFTWTITYQFYKL